MRRADRLFRIVEYLKARRQAVTADTLAIELEVSVRTVYRDIVDLCDSGVPVIGEAGVGYVLDRDYTVRPLIFDTEELDALDGKQSERTVRPLCLAFFGPVWLFMGWCETRRDFRNFRLDRMTELRINDERFADERGKRLSDYRQREASNGEC
jgi:predicted DNA-binding transcriptional regulator YafY